MDVVRAWWRSVWKTLLHLLTGASEVERILSGREWSVGWLWGALPPPTFHTPAMTTKLLGSIKRSKQLATVRDRIFTLRTFAPELVCNMVEERKNLNEERIIIHTNLVLCLQQTRAINGAILGLEATAKQSFDRSVPIHENLLEELWELLKPGVRRTGGALSSEWGELGFQGNDPATDFRGMGLLGLQQLVYFARERPSMARHNLTLSHHPRRYYPFATTGINVTAFVLSLATERRLDGIMLQAVNRSEVEGEGDDRELVLAGEEAAHGVYCDVMEAFAALWEERDPENVMAFRHVFAEVKARFHRIFPVPY